MGVLVYSLRQLVVADVGSIVISEDAELSILAVYVKVPSAPSVGYAGASRTRTSKCTSNTRTD